MNEYDKLIQDIWRVKEDYIRLIPKSKYDFNDYTLNLMTEIK